MSYGIRRLEIKNTLRIESVVIEPDEDGNLVIIGGMNGAGKTSIIEALKMLLQGMKLAPPKPVRDGCKASEILGVLDDITVSRTTSAKTGRSQLIVKANDGKRLTSPQAILDNLFGALSFDPLAFMRMEVKKQAEELRALVGLDFSGLEERRAALYEDRTVEGREVKRLIGALESLPQHRIGDGEEVDIAAVSEEMQKRQMQNAGNDKVRGRLEAARSSEATASAELKVRQSDVEQAARELKYAQENVDNRQRFKEQADVELGKKKAAVEAYEVQVGRLKDLDLSDLQQKMASAEEHNAKVRENERHREMKAEMNAAERRRDVLSSGIADLDEEREQALAVAEFPVDGLGFDENGVTMKDLPFEQASDAEKLRVSVAMAIALNPKLKVILVRDGSLLDDKSMILIGEMAKAAEAQVWIERVGEGKECTVIIEDGRLKEVEAVVTKDVEAKVVEPQDQENDA